MATSGITDYQVQYRQTVAGGNFALFGSPAPNINSVTVTGLLPGVGYDFQVIATNNIGAVYSSIVTGMTIAVTGAPAPVTNVQVTTTTGSVTVSYTNSISGTTPITYNTLLAPSGSTLSGYGSGNPITISGLTPATTYAIQVQASNIYGIATVSTGATTQSSIVIPPSAPTLTLATSASGGLATISAAYSNSLSGTTPITYTMFYEISGSGSWTTAYSATASAVVTVTGLNLNTTYVFQVSASNSSGSVTSNAVSILTDTACSPITNLVLTDNVSASGASQSIGLTFSGSASGTQPIYYLVQYEGGVVTGWATLQNSTALYGTILSVAPSTTYYVQVIANNIVGSATAVSASITTAATGIAPNAPVMTLGTITATSIAYSYTNSTSGTLPITYQVQYTSGSTWTVWNTTSPITGLAPLTAYSVEVIASNTYGTATSNVATGTTLTNSLPAPPTGILAIVSGNTAMNLSWSASVSGATPITYIPAYERAGSGAYTNWSGTTGLTALVTGLVSGVDYYFNVTATNAAGSGAGTPIVQPTLPITIWGVSSGMTLTSGSLVATTSAATQAGVISNTTRYAGIVYAEFAYNTASSTETVGFANSAWVLTGASGVGGDNNSFGVKQNGAVYLNNAQVGNAMPALTTGETLGMVVNFNVNKAWFTTNGSTWDASGSGDNPTTLSGGYSFSGMAAGPYYLAYNALSTSNGASGFNASQINSLSPNPGMTGATIGVSALPPANTILPAQWFTYNDPGIVTTVIATGWVSGLPYVTIQLSGTTTTTFDYIVFGGSTAAAGTTGFGSFYYALTSGTTGGIASFYQAFDFFTSSGAYVSTISGALTTPTSALQLSMLSGAIPTTAANHYVSLGYNTGTAINLTLQLAGIQFNSYNQYNNPTLSGGVTGTTTLPTNWYWYGDTGLTATLLATGTISGSPYATVNISGTAASTQVGLFFTLTQPAYPQSATISCEYAMTSGALANITNWWLETEQWTSAPTYLNSVSAAISAPTSAFQTAVLSIVNPATTAIIRPGIHLGYAAGAAINVTLQISNILVANPGQPVIVGPLSGFVSQIAKLPLSGITFVDTNQPLAGNCTLDLYCTGGTISVSAVTSGTVTGNGTSAIVVADTFANLQTVMKSAVYTAPSTSGTSSIAVQLTDQVPLSSTIVFPVTVTTGAADAKTMNAGEQTFAFATPTSSVAWDQFQPGSFTVVGIGASGNVMLNWTQPSYGTAPITYTIQDRKTGGSNWATVISGLAYSTTSATVTGIGSGTTATGFVSGTSYDFQMLAYNPYGSYTVPFISVTTSQGESPNLYNVNGVTGQIVYASTTGGVADPSGPWLEFYMVTSVASGNQVELASTSGGSPVLTNSGDVTNLWYWNHYCYQTNSTSGWWYWGTAASGGVVTGWNEYGVNTFTVTPSAYTVGAGVGTVVGTLSTTMKDGTAFSGTYMLSDTTDFKVVGSTIQANTTVTQNSYAISVTAVPYLINYAGQTSSPEAVVASATITSGGAAPSPPSQAVAAGFTTLVFNDDFTSDTIYPVLTSNSTYQSGYNWYWDQCINSTSDYAVSGSLTAATIPTTLTINGVVIPQGNSGGGSNASPNGGILTFLLQPGSGGNPFNGCIATVPYNSNVQSVYRGTQGTFGHGYIEAYIQFNPAIESVPPAGQSDSATFYPWGWPAWWSTGAPNASTGDYTEIDFMEFYGNAFTPGHSTTATTIEISVIDWDSPGITGDNGHGSADIDANWHTYGCLWTGNGTSGMLTFYFDNVECGSTPVGTATTSTSGGAYLEANPYQILRLGCGNQWPMNVDWVRVWQA